MDRVDVQQMYEVRVKYHEYKHMDGAPSSSSAASAGTRSKDTLAASGLTWGGKDIVDVAVLSPDPRINPQIQIRKTNETSDEV